MNSLNFQQSKSFGPAHKVLNIQLPTFGSPDVSSDENISDSLSKEDSDECLHMSHTSEEFTESDKKILELVRKTSKMKIDEIENQQFVEDKLAELRDRLSGSTHVLRKTENHIKNIKFMHQQNMIEISQSDELSRFLENPDESLELLNIQMEEIERKLNEVQEKTRNFKETRKAKNPTYSSYLTSMNDAVQLLENIGKGDYNHP